MKPVLFAADNTFLLYVKENEIRGVDLKTAHYNVIPSITVPFVENASAIDYDVQTDRLYWTDSKRHVITSAFFNGTGVQTIIDTGKKKRSCFYFCFYFIPPCGKFGLPYPGMAQQFPVLPIPTRACSVFVPPKFADCVSVSINKCSFESFLGLDLALER